MWFETTSIRTTKHSTSLSGSIPESHWSRATPTWHWLTGIRVEVPKQCFGGIQCPNRFWGQVPRFQYSSVDTQLFIPVGLVRSRTTRQRIVCCGVVGPSRFSRGILTFEMVFVVVLEITGIHETCFFSELCRWLCSKFVWVLFEYSFNCDQGVLKGLQKHNNRATTTLTV